LCLEEYIEFIADFTRSDPLGVMFRDSFYEVYFTRDMEVFIPFDCEFDISGNNADGFIVTIKR
jgi:D-alanyl-D-alanine carboxypeptidase